MTRYLLDTNVLSELPRPQPDPAVVRFIASIPERQLLISVLSLGEIRRGIERLPVSRRRVQFEAWFQHDLIERFKDRLLGVDLGIAEAWGQLSAVQLERGRTLPVVDGLLAATALYHGLSLVTRNVRDFDGLGAPVVNPWKRLV
ncbi:MAG: type II toxin-antitoxin system VapC family toxin [Acidobacteria bacterium]|nr:type II toxin-antitoxin system VapC family toxin [Acidobacteriota bacterium]